MKELEKYKELWESETRRSAQLEIKLDEYSKAIKAAHKALADKDLEVAEHRQWDVVSIHRDLRSAMSNDEPLIELNSSSKDESKGNNVSESAFDLDWDIEGVGYENKENFWRWVLETSILFGVFSFILWKCYNFNKYF